MNADQIKELFGTFKATCEEQGWGKPTEEDTSHQMICAFFGQEYNLPESYVPKADDLNPFPKVGKIMNLLDVYHHGTGRLRSNTYRLLGKLTKTITDSDMDSDFVASDNTQQYLKARRLWDSGIGYFLGFNNFRAYYSTIPTIDFTEEQQARFSFLQLVDGRMTALNHMRFAGIERLKTFNEYTLRAGGSEDTSVRWIRAREMPEDTLNDAYTALAPDETSIDMNEALALHWNWENWRDRSTCTPLVVASALANKSGDSPYTFSWEGDRMLAHLPLKDTKKGKYFNADNHGIFARAVPKRSSFVIKFK